MIPLLVSVFGPDAPTHPITWYQTVDRAALIFLAGLLLVRIGKTRLLGRTTGFDILLSVILGATLARAVNGQASLSGTLAASGVLVALHWLIGWVGCLSPAFDRLIKGRRRQVVDDGRVLWHNLRGGELTRDDLEEALRLHGGTDELSRVRAAFLERNGEISVVLRGD